MYIQALRKTSIGTAIMSGEQAPWFSSEEADAAQPTSLPVIQAEFPPLTSAGVDIIILSVVLPLFATAWTGLRIWTRRLRGISILFLEDILCYISVVSLQNNGYLGLWIGN